MVKNAALVLFVNNQRLMIFSSMREKFDLWLVHAIINQRLPIPYRVGLNYEISFIIITLALYYEIEI